MDPQPLPVELTVDHGDHTLTCRLPTLNDIDALVEACQDPEIPRWTTVPNPYGPENGRGFVEYAAVQWGSRAGLELLITAEPGHPLETLPILGAVDGRIRWKEEEATVGYWIHADARRQGVASAALAGMCRWLIDLGIKRIEAEVVVGNVGSAKTLQKLGFQLEGTKRQEYAGACGVDADRIDTHQFGLLAPEFVNPEV